MRCFPLLAACLLVTGCGGESEAPRNMSREDVTAEVSDVRVAAGEWEHSTEVLAVEAPNLSPETAARIRERRTSFRYCITPEQAAQPARVSDVIARPREGCTVRDFTMRDGRMEGRMGCREGTPGEISTAMTGTYAPEHFDYRSQVEMPAPLVGGIMRLDVRTTGRRIGQCPVPAPAQGEGKQ